MVSIKAGPCEPIPKADIPRFLPEFLGGLLRIAHEDAQGYDVVHSHYWLSGWVGRAAKHALDAPLVSSFHTLGKVKNYSLARGEPPEPAVRIAGEQAVIDESDRILAPTPSEASQLVGLYRADARTHPDRATGRRPRVVRAAGSRAGAGSGSTCPACGSRSTWAGCRPTKVLTSRCAPWPRRSPATPRPPAIWCWRSSGAPAGPRRAPRSRGCMELAGALGVSRTRDAVPAAAASRARRLSTPPPTWCWCPRGRSPSGSWLWRRRRAARPWWPPRWGVCATWSRTAGPGSWSKATTPATTPSALLRGADRRRTPARARVPRQPSGPSGSRGMRPPTRSWRSTVRCCRRRVFCAPAPCLTCTFFRRCDRSSRSRSELSLFPASL